MRNPKISVIIPVYNTQTWLRDCLDSVLRQTMSDFEIICVDDGSTDRSGSVLREYAAGDERISVISQSNRGVSAARNAGLQAARGKYLYFLDSDDYIEPDLLEITCGELDGRNLDIVLFDAVVFAEKGIGQDEIDKRSKYYTVSQDYSEIVTGEELLYRLIKHRDFNCSVCKQVVRKDLLERHQLCFDEGVVKNEDDIYSFRVLALAGQASYIHRALFHRRLRAQSAVMQTLDFRSPYGYFVCVKEGYRFLRKQNYSPDKMKVFFKKLNDWAASARKEYMLLEENERNKAEQLPDEDRFLFRLCISDYSDKEIQINENKYLLQRVKQQEEEKQRTQAPYAGKPAQDWQEAGEMAAVVKDAANVRQKTVLYFSPHQDDELLSMGIDICNSVNTGQDVHVILCTDGSRCSVRKHLADGKECCRHEGVHNYSLTEEDFIAARDREFQASCKALGVKDCNIHIPATRFIDRKLTVCNSKELILQYLNAAGTDCIVCTMDPNNENNKQHRDHKALGYAAVELFNEGVIRELRLFTEPYYPNAFHHEMDVVRGTCRWVIESAAEPVQETIRKVSEAYSRWEPECGRYAIGYHDISEAFNALLKNGASYCHICKRETEVPGKKTEDIKCRKLIVSLTSYPARINGAVLALNTIYDQRVTPDMVILWLAAADFPNREKDLPEKLLKMILDEGLSIRWIEEDLKPHNKYYWTFKEYPEALVITIDDDILYHSQLTENLYRSYLLHPRAVSAARICFVPVSESGILPPYEFWPVGVDCYVSVPSMQFCATGAGGVLYPVHLFSKVEELLDAETIKRICLYEDDLWLKAMELVAGVPVVVAEEFQGLRYTPDSQEVRLYHENIGNGRSQAQLLQIQKEIDDRYGEGTFLKKLTDTAVGVNLTGNTALCKVADHYRIKAEIQAARAKRIGEKYSGYRKYCTLRIDIRNKGIKNCNVIEQSVRPAPIFLRRPGWLPDGITIEADSGRMTVELQCLGDGNLEIGLLGRDVRNAAGKRYPVWIDCTYFAVNGETIFNDTRTVCHDKRYVYRKPVTNGEVISLTVCWTECRSSYVLDESRLLQADLRKASAKAKRLERVKSETEKRLKTTQAEAAKLKRELDNVKSGWSFKLGRAITWLPRKLR